MKKHQFEEITAALSIIIALIAYGQEVYWLAFIFGWKAIADTYYAIKYSHKAAKYEKAGREIK